MHNKDLGYAAEQIVLARYVKAGWNLLDQNKTERGSELDLVLEKTHRKGERITREILFVEVKALESDNIDGLTPEDNFTSAKQRHFRRGIELYLSKNKLHEDNIRIRIDLACVYHHRHKPKAEEWSIKVYENIILE